MAGETTIFKKPDHELILEASYKASEFLLYWNEMTLNRLTDINKNLIGMALLLIPIVGALAVPHKYLILTIDQKFMIQSILSLLFWAVVLGFGQIVHEYIILRYYNYKNSKRAATLYNNQNKLYKTAIKEADEFRIKSDTFMFIMASLPYCLIVEGALIISVLIKVSSLVNSFLGI